MVLWTVDSQSGLWIEQVGMCMDRTIFTSCNSLLFSCSENIISASAQMFVQCVLCTTCHLHRYVLVMWVETLLDFMEQCFLLMATIS